MLDVALAVLAAGLAVLVATVALRVLRAALRLRATLAEARAEGDAVLTSVATARARAMAVQRDSATRRVALDAELADLQRTLGVFALLLQAAGDGLAPARSARRFLRGR